MLELITAILLPLMPVQEQPVANDDTEKRICKFTTDTGSLVRRKRECRTKNDWDRIAEAARQGAQDMVDRHSAGSTRGN